MKEKQKAITRSIDLLIFVFFIIFLLSLGNSIFVNQIGYFGALFFILLKILVTKQNQFSKTGLELAFALYILAEILSLIFSEYPAEAFNHLVKRVAVIPIFYTTVVATDSLKTGKRYFSVYLIGMLGTILVYLFFSAKQYVNDLYSTMQSGPSLFQFPITTSEIISFTVLFLFAFLVNEKTSKRIKIYTFLGFMVSLLALISTYKRTGWIGTAFGIVLILIITKRWKTLAVAVLIVGAVFIMDKNKSEVIVFDVSNNTLEEKYSFETEGRASNFTSLDSMYVVADFENGLSLYSSDKLVKNVILSDPVESFNQVNDSIFLASLYDTRLLFLKRNGFNFTKVNELVSPGDMTEFKFLNKMLYVRDSDSGLTVFKNPFVNDDHITYPELNFAENFFADSTFIYLGGNDKLQIRKLKNFLPDNEIVSELSDPIKLLNAGNGRIIISRDKRIELLDDNFNLLDSIYIDSNVKNLSEDGENLYLISDENKIINIQYSRNDSLKITAIYDLGFDPSAFYADDSRIYTGVVKRSRLLSIFDPYLQTNFVRFALWRAGWEIFKDHPLFGVGDVDLAKYYLKYKRPVDKEVHGHLHNNYIHFLATLGLFGFLVLMYLFFKLFQIMTKYFKESKKEQFINSYFLGAIAGLACTLVSGLTELNFWDQEIATLIYFTAGLSVALYNHKKEHFLEVKEEH